MAKFFDSIIYKTSDGATHRIDWVDPKKSHQMVNKHLNKPDCINAFSFMGCYKTDSGEKVLLDSPMA